jgi:hypothetical protein
MELGLPFVRVDNATLHGFNLRVVRQHVNTTIGAPEKRAQQPADNSNNDRAPERASETIHVEAWNKGRNPQQQQSVNHEDKKTKRQKNERCAQKQQDWPHKGV